MSTDRAHAYPVQTLSGERRSLDYGRVGVWFFRALLLIPFVLMAPEVVSASLGRPDGVANVSASTADVLGTSTFLIFILMLAVTPIETMTGWRWHVVLRRDYGIAMFATAAFDLTLAAISTGDTFPGTVLTHIGGHTFLLAGTLSTLLLIPLVATANRPAQRWLGRHWKAIQRLTYVVWGTVLLHLLLLFGLSTIFLYAVAVSIPLAVIRIPSVRHWWTSARRTGSRRVARAVAAVALVAVFSAGFVPLASELAQKGFAAVTQHPARD